MRHGEAEGRGSEGDEARALTVRGIADCQVLAEHFKDEGITWDAILCSSARRARASAELIAAAMNPPPALGLRADLYLAKAEIYAAALRALPDAVGAVLLVGHNPGVHALTRGLTARGGGRAARQAAREFPPGAMAVFACDVEAWADLAPGAASLRNFVTPGDISFKKTNKNSDV